MRFWREVDLPQLRPDGLESAPSRPASRTASQDAVFSALLEDNIDDLYDTAPCGNLSTLLDGTIAKVNTTLLGWLGYTRDELVGRKRFSDLLTAGGKIYHETHLAPLLQMQGEVNGIALDLKAADGTRLPVLIAAAVKTGSDGQPLLIRTTVFDARERRAYEQELLRARQQAERDRERLRALVAGLQRSLLPASVPSPPGMQTAAYYHMASQDEVGGDFYDLFPIRDDRWGFFLGDVCGKGVGAAAVTAAARYTLRAAAVYDPDPAAVLTNLNSVLHQDYPAQSHRHCTVTFGILAPAETGYDVTIAGGGHPAPLVLRAGGTVEAQPTTGGALIGILAEPRIATRTFALSPGDTLVLYSDGLTEARTGTNRDRRPARLRREPGTHHRAWRHRRPDQPADDLRRPGRRRRPAGSLGRPHLTRCDYPHRRQVGAHRLRVNRAPAGNAPAQRTRMLDMSPGTPVA